MRLHHLIATLPVLLALLASCESMATPAADPVREEAAIRATDAHWLAAAQSHDLEGTVSYWSDDVYMMPPGGPPIVGKEALRRYVADALAIPDFSITWVTDSHVLAGGQAGGRAQQGGGGVEKGAGWLVEVRRRHLECSR